MEETTKEEVFFLQTLLENQSLEEKTDEIEEEQDLKSLEEVEQIIGYKFNDQTLLRAALTHGSYKRKCSFTCTYERLEYVGDAVLNLITARDDYFSYPNLSPGILTRLRAANVDTEKLARVAIDSNLHKYLCHKNPSLDKQISEFTSSISEFPLHSHGLVDAPKVLADIVESTIGAIFIDCGSCLHTTSKVVKNLLKPIIIPETLGTHPMTKLCEICQKHGKIIRFVDLWEENGTIEVYVDDNFVAKCNYSQKRSIAWNRAANNAYNEITKMIEENAVAAQADSLLIDIS